MKQGKRIKQIQDSEKYVFLGFVAITILIIGIIIGRII